MLENISNAITLQKLVKLSSVVEKINYRIVIVLLAANIAHGCFRVTMA
jgi:hypothetical protein